MSMLDIWWLPDWVLLLVVIAVLTVLYSRYFADNRVKYGLPGPDRWPFVGHLPLVFKLGFLEFHKHLCNKYGKVVALSPGTLDAGMGTLLISDLDMIKEILVKQGSIFVDRNVDEKTQVKPLNKTILSLKGDEWKQVRGTMTPTFSSGKLRQMNGHIVDCAKTTVKNLQEIAKKDGSFDAEEIWGAFAMDSICATAFGIKVDSQNNPEEPFVTNARQLQNASLANPFLLLFLFFPRLMVWFEPLLPYLIGSFIKPIRFFQRATDELYDESQKSKNEKAIDFVHLMQKAHELHMDYDELADDVKEVGKWKKRALTRDEIVANGIVFFLAGFRNTMSTLSFMCYNLAIYPEIQERLQKEIDDTLQGTDPSYDNVASLQYLDQVMSETLRMYPLGFVLDRVPNQDTTVKGMIIPKGTGVIVPVYAIHFDPELYPDPEKFDPERFTPEEKADRNPYSYMPFGMGPRNCIGMRLALLQMKVAIVKVLQNLTFKTCEKTQIPLKFMKSRPFTPEKGIWLKVEERCP
ncbi:cytochrome P450 3A24 [Lingula anatina]|uniref:Cytochrome P450 3A24 n=1 Tax=Lingula anatina TaxID=7574 RepID=A0A1S3ID98_LINAN|nr:cytochrome P450 3A24 [Lingula anatina]|eukprot:XP_013396133.1 cytochrome P450 3A24 [Lingula anatina]